MPNIRQIITLKEKYNQLSRQEKLVKGFIDDALIEGIKISKGFSQRTVEHFDYSKLTPSLIDYFESKPKESVVLLFVDIAGFSKIAETKGSNWLSNYLDSYYRRAFPIIYKYGGQIEKLMGDGIICVFGEPFIQVDWPEEFNRAELCAMDLIRKFQYTNKEVKVSLHNGEITYYKTPGADYEEYTMIGKPITELYRLESVSKVNAINFYKGSMYDAINPTKALGLSKIEKDTGSLYGFDVNLQGVSYDRVRYFKLKENG